MIIQRARTSRVIASKIDNSTWPRSCRPVQSRLQSPLRLWAAITKTWQRTYIKHRKHKISLPVRLCTFVQLSHSVWTCAKRVTVEAYTGLFSNSVQGRVSRKTLKLFGPTKPWQNLEPLQLRLQRCFIHIFLIWTAVPLHKKFQAYTLLRF